VKETHEEQLLEEVEIRLVPAVQSGQMRLVCLSVLTDQVGSGVVVVDFPVVVVMELLEIVGSCFAGVDASVGVVHVEEEILSVLIETVVIAVAVGPTRGLAVPEIEILVVTVA
jgi:hypothetical protein